MPIDLPSQHFDQYGKGNPHHDYERTPHSGESYRTQVLLPFINRLKAMYPEPHVLDLASGKGEAADYLESQGCQTTRLDISELGLGLSQGNRVASMMEQLPFAKDSFHAIHSKDGMVHSPAPIMVLKEARRVLKSSGTFLIASQEVPHAYYLARNLAPEKQLHNRERLEDEEDEFVVVDFQSVDEYLASINYYAKLRDPAGNPVFDQFSPPYFLTTRRHITSRAIFLHFKVDSLGEWQPPDTEKDWHDSSVPRFVLELTKTAPSTQ